MRNFGQGGDGQGGAGPHMPGTAGLAASEEMPSGSTGPTGVAGVDWEAVWRAYTDGRVAPASAGEWDARAAKYAATGADTQTQSYEGRFLKLTGIRPGERVLDFGCGVGLLAIPLAQMGCQVVCADFSQGMLDELTRRAQAAGVAERIEPRLVAWDDDWAARGIGEEDVDVAIACRSLATRHLTHALASLDAAARRRVCLSVVSNCSPRGDMRAFEAVGRPRPVVQEHALVLNTLMARGISPELTYITTRVWPGFSDRDRARESLAQLVGGGLSAQEEARLDAFLDAHYAPDSAMAVRDPRHALKADRPREVRWAFIAWDA